ncbi:MAG: GNAT family N-acetyltransferase, partial [Actinobacteria bacterium]|nr:GNAT family N-acetyltransferase [Actinomycetota bacterium]
MPIEIRVTTPDEYRAAADVFRGALLSPPSTDDDWAKPSIVDSWSDGHSVSAWEGARCVGHASAFHFTTVVPGGATVPTAAITRIGVRQTHTRQGVLTRAMHRLLHDAVAQGKVLASLRASEAVIYGRFGFAVAGETWSIEIDRLRGVRVTAPTAAGSIRLLERDE